MSINNYRFDGDYFSCKEPHVSINYKSYTIIALMVIISPAAGCWKNMILSVTHPKSFNCLINVFFSPSYFDVWWFIMISIWVLDLIRQTNLMSHSYLTLREVNFVLPLPTLNLDFIKYASSIKHSLNLSQLQKMLF